MRAIRIVMMKKMAKARLESVGSRRRFAVRSIDESTVKDRFESFIALIALMRRKLKLRGRQNWGGTPIQSLGSPGVKTKTRDWIKKRVVRKLSHLEKNLLNNNRGFVLSGGGSAADASAIRRSVGH